MLQLVAEGLDDLLDWSARLAYGLALELRGVVVVVLVVEPLPLGLRLPLSLPLPYLPLPLPPTTPTPMALRSSCGVCRSRSS